MRISDWSSDVCSSDLDLERYDEDPIERPLQHAINTRYGIGLQAVLALGAWEYRNHGIAAPEMLTEPDMRSEERRVGKEVVSTGRSRWSPDHSKKNEKTRTRYNKIHLSKK